MSTMNMEDFNFVYKPGNTELDYLTCKHCGERVERGITNVSDHWMKCLKRKEGLVIIAEMEKCKEDPVYFYNKYFRKEGMPKLTKEQWDDIMKPYSPIKYRSRT